MQQGLANQLFVIGKPPARQDTSFTLAQPCALSMPRPRPVVVQFSHGMPELNGAVARTQETENRSVRRA